MENRLEYLYNTVENTIATKLILQQDFRTYLDIMFYLVNENPFTFKPFHDDIINYLQLLAEGDLGKRNLCLNVPVGAGKSIIVEFFITWCFARSINHTFCYVSHSDRLINRLSKEAKDIVEHPAWQAIFNTPLKKDDRSRVNWSFANASNRTGLTAGTMGGGLTGLDAGNPNKEGFKGALIIDDPMDAGDAIYPNSREEVIRFYDEKLATRRRTPDTPTILIMQRLHKEDLTGWLTSIEPEDWEVVIIPALQDDISFWEEKYPVKELKHIEKINANKFWAQYQQNPITAGGQVIQSKWFKFYNPGEIQFTRTFMTGDTAQKTKEWNDYSVICYWGLDGCNLYLIDILRGKWEAPDLRNNVGAFWNKYALNSPYAFYIEDKASGTGLIQDLMRTTSIPVIAVQRDKDKLTRVEDILTYIESGRVKLPISKEYSFNKDFIAECESFARDLSHSHDDIVDNLCDAVTKGLDVGSLSIFDVL